MNRYIHEIFFFVLMVPLFVHAQDTEQPNIVFILTDDQRWDALGAAGNDIIETPEMDRLANEGTMFSEAFVTTPICAASRASIMSGQYERTHGFTFRTPPISKKLARSTYPALLKKAGYATGFVGKLGMNYQKDFEKKIFDYLVRPSERGRWRGHFYSMTDSHGHKHITEEIGDRSLEFIREHAGKTPFCLSVSFHAPHADDQFPSQYIYPTHLQKLYKDATIPLAPLSSKQYFDQQFPAVQKGLNYLRWLWRFDSEEKYQEKVKSYYRMITGVDEQLGRIRAQLEEAGVSDNTVIIFMSDNGYFLNERLLAGKWLMYENSLRVPCILYDPREVDRPATSDDIVLNVDIAPTILNYAGLELPSSMQGRPIQKILSGEEARAYFLCEHLFVHPQIPRSEGIRTRTAKYFRYLDQPSWEEYYDLATDPHEKNNLIEDQSKKEEIDRMRKLLDEELRLKTSAN